MDINTKQILLLDMNSTFMFGEDRFGEHEDFFQYYKTLGGKLDSVELNQTIRSIYQYLESIYPAEEYRHCFPTLVQVIDEIVSDLLTTDEVEKIVETFAFHELGYVSEEYANALRKLQKRFVLAAIIDIWSPKRLWLDEFSRAGIDDLFSAISFSSDHGIVKPSAKPYLTALAQLGIQTESALIIGDSVRRDLGSARLAGIDCILVGGSEHADAISYENLLSFAESIG